MTKLRRLAVLFLLTATSGVAIVAAQDFPQPRPGPEHEALKMMEGTWDAAIKMTGAPQESRGTMTCTMEMGGLWLVSQFKGDFGGLAFQGRGLDSFDSAKKKYVGIWVDSMSTSPMVMEGSFNKDKKQMVMIGDGPGPDGKPAKHKMVSNYVDKDTVDWSMSLVDKDGKEAQMMTIKYTRKK